MNRFFILFLLVYASAISQNKIEGSVVDRETDNRLAYATIKLLNTKYYTITNADGNFEFTLPNKTVVDSLEVRHLGFKPKVVSVNYFKINEKLYLEPYIENIKEVLITHKDKDYAYNLLKKLIQKYRTSELQSESKSFLSINSSSRRIPIESLEGFYNSKLSVSGGIDSLSIKSGRFGQNKAFSFYSLNNTKILEDFKTFKLANQILPNYPGNLNISKIKSKYTVNVSDCKTCDLEDLLITFTPKRDNGRLFNGTIIFDNEKLVIKKIELWAINPKTNGLSSIQEKDVFKPSEIRLNIVYNPLDLMQIQYLDFVFNMEYKSDLSTFETIKSRSFMYFYDYDKTFETPFFIKAPHFKNDYDNIIALQATEDFWDLNYQFPKSYNDVMNINFLKREGHLIHYSNTIPLDYLDIIKPSTICWNNEARIKWAHIKLKTNSKYKTHDKSNVDFDKTRVVDHVSHSATDMMKQSGTIKNDYKLDFNYVVDAFEGANNTTLYMSRTIFNKNNSYFTKNRSKNVLISLNLAFDIYEYYRQEMENEVKNNKVLTYDEVKKRYKFQYHKASKMVNKMLSETNTGLNYQKVVEWNKKIINKLGVNNYSLISKDY